MTEAEWLAATDTTEVAWLAATDPAVLLRYIRPRTRGRKKRLFACACCRSIWEAMSDDICRRAVEVAERLADGEVEDDERANASEAVAARSMALETNNHFEASAENRKYYASQAAVYALSYGNDVWHAPDLAIAALEGEADRAAYKAAQHDVLRDLFGNPFRPVAIEPSWLTSDVRILAEGIYEDRAFDRMPILADALQDAGCDNTDILNHCRQPGEHVRGCWVVDLLLGKNRR